MVTEYTGNQLIRDKAHQIVFESAKLPAKARAAHAVAIGEWVQKNIRYVNEGIETFQSPVRTLTYRYGDCDDFTTLIASLLEAIGIRSELVALEWEGSYRHIFPRAVVPGPDGRSVRLPLDATLSVPVDRLTNPIAEAIKRGRQVRALVL